MQGVQGPQGSQGNADVMVDTFSLTGAQFAWNSWYTFASSNGSYTEYFTRYHDCPFSAVTADVLASGMVLAYFVPDTASYPNQWVPLPYTFLAFNSAFYYNFVYQTSVGSVRIHYFYTANGAGPWGRRYKKLQFISSPHRSPATAPSPPPPPAHPPRQASR